MSGTVVGWRDGLLVVRRAFSAGGRYDSLGAPKLAGDWGTVEIVPGGWVLRRTYSRANGQLIGELFNIQMPVELGVGEVRYVDLEIDVVRTPEGRVEVVDENELNAVERSGAVPHATAERARGIAHQLAAILRAGGDWRKAAGSTTPPVSQCRRDIV